MYYALKDTARMLKERECVVLFPVDNTENLRHIHPVYAILLALCDGQQCKEDLCRVLIEALSIEEARAGEMVEKIGSDFSDFLDSADVPMTSTRRYDPGDFIYEPQGDPNFVHLRHPIGIAWLVTERCPYDCIYCCIPTVLAAARPPGELTPEEGMRFLEDCVATGVQSVTLYGGEPFLRRDLLDLIRYLLEHDVYVSISTKLKLSEKIVRQLAAAGLDELQLSIDSPRPEVADKMVALPNYLEKAYRNIDLLNRYGIGIRINTVVTSHNVKDVPELIRHLAGKGVRKFTLSRYLRSIWKHDDQLFPGRDKLEGLAEEVAKIEASSGIAIQMHPLMSPREISIKTKGYSSCSGGKTGLVVRADGKVSFCDRLLPFDDAIVGDVKRSTLMDIWRGESLRAFTKPDDAEFTGTVCASCGLKEACHERMRCSYRSFLVDSRLFGPDYLCQVIPPPPIRFS